MIVLTCLNSSPVMVYAGQELGERGMDSEGFSGTDGRTTIFDYWSLTTLQHGYYNRRKMKREERELLQDYSRLLSLANQEDALREGCFYDLMYVNPQLSERQFAFLRKYDRQLMLVIANFDECGRECPVVLPRHAFDYLQLPEGEYKAIDLLSANTRQLTLSPDTPVNVILPANGGIIYKMIT